ncbi:MAG: GNAT family N-acetyltransferase [Candidatus Kaiserbacteria bacterium]|nr:MAG: GNAT family N-acetyltransferase [Candidatus Kaiserbacteria bacterium]
MQVRRATKKDFEEMLEVQIASFRTLTDTYSPDQIAAWEKRATKKGGKRFEPYASLVCVEGGRIVAFATWGIKRDTGWLRCLYVLPRWMRKGIGSRLLKSAERTMLDAGVRRIRIKSAPSARPFYERHGYRYVEDGKSSAGFDVAIMKKAIPEG